MLLNIQSQITIPDIQKKKGKSDTYSKEMESYLNIICMLELAEKNFKAVITNMLNVTKESTYVLNKWTNRKSQMKELQEYETGFPWDAMQRTA